MSVATVPDDERARPDDDSAVTDSLLRRGARVLARFVRLNPLPFSIAIAGAVVYAGASVLGTLVLGRVTDKVLTPAFRGSGVSDSTTWAWVALIVGVSFLRAIGTVTRRYFAGKTTWLGQAWLRNAIADHFLAVPLDFHRGSSTGELLAHADSDVLAATEVVNPLPFSTGLIVLIIFSVIALFVVDPILALVGLVLFPLMALLNRYYTRRVERPAAAVQAHVGAVSGIAHESFDGALMVKSLGLEEHEVTRLAAAADELRKERVEVGRLRAFFEPALDALPNLGIIAILAVGSWRISEGAISPGDVVQAMALFTLLAFPMRVVGFLLEEMPRAVVATERLDRVLAVDVAPDPHDHASPPASPAEVEVRDLRYSYPSGDPVLTDVSFSLAAGEVVALVGPTGCGKSTLCELLVGLVAPDSGTIQVHGLAPDRLRRDTRRDLLALVFQESFVFADTVQENVLVGTDHGPDRLAHALEVAQATRFVAGLPAGTRTILGERGVSLSGGQRQRLALARALARRPQLLVLDDATSAIDPRVEALILAALREELRMTTLVVAQRRSTVELADRIIRMQAGRVVATGTHAELLATDPEYAAMLSAYDSAVPGDYDDE
jgi:ABC-type multidrug transport system fused ATPase/permease subunit